MEIHIEIDTKEVSKYFNKIETQLGKTNEFMRARVFPIVKDEIKKNFLTEGRPGAGRQKWEGLSQSRKNQRRKQGYPPDHPILRASGNLYRNVLSNLRVTGGGNLFKIGIMGNEEDTKIMRALHCGIPSADICFLGFGSRDTGVTTRTHRLKSGKVAGPYDYRLPPRPFMFITKTALVKIGKEATDFFYKFR